MASLKKDFHQFFYQALGGDNLMSIINKQIPPSKLAQFNLLENRALLQVEQKEDMRINAQRYADVFKLSQTVSDPDLALKQSDYIAGTMGFMLNTGAFLSTIELLGDEKQVKYWQDQVLRGKAVGGYGQTEVGHGSDVKNLQTTATYNLESKTWAINSPKITSAKFWPGLLGHFSTHLVVQAKTFVKGQKLGNQTFVLRIRTNKLQDVPKVETFDIGPKLGFAKVDNGGIYFKNLQAPRDAMLMRYVTVQDDGTVKGLENESAIKYSYGSMLNLRIRLTNYFGWGSIISPNLSLYQLLKDMGKEKQAQHRKFLIEHICLGYGIILSNINLVNYYNLFKKQLAAKNYDQADKLLIMIHIASSNFKALSSRFGIDTNSNILTYNEVSKFQTTGIPLVFVSYIPSATYEGDNIVLLQQTSKFLLAKFASEREVKGLKRSFRSNDWEAVSRALEFIILKRVSIIKKRIEKYNENDIPYQTVWNEKQQTNLIQTSILWGYMTFLKNFTIVLSSIKNNEQFYRKICEEFTNFIVKKTINDFFVQDFTVEMVQTWKNFTEQQYIALMEMDYPIRREPEPNRYIQRQDGNWLNAKL